MKIYSWNALCFNRNVPEAVEYIRSLDFDVLCLQEVTPELLAALKDMPFHLAYHTDAVRLFVGGGRQRDHVAILSRHEFTNTGTLQFLDFPFPLRTRAFILFMSLFKWAFVTGRGALYADIPYRGSWLRVFSAHLTLWGPHNRAREFTALVEHVEPGAPAVIAGDFNIVEYGPMKILNWLLGAPLSQATPWYPERDIFEERFAEVGFKNPLRGNITHRFSRSQLDHILLSESLASTEAGVEENSRGSDHQPVWLTLTP